MFKYAVIALLILSSAPRAGAVEFKSFDKDQHSQTVTECDRVAAHPDDPSRVTRGVETREMDLPAAIAACRRDLAQDQSNPRLRYQLARALTYAGEVKEALPFIESSAAQKYPQSLFVTGYLYLSGAYQSPKDVCRAAELIYESAIYGRHAGQLGYPAYVLEGRFAACKTPQDKATLRALVEQARKSKLDYYPSVLADVLLRELR
jgi:predicted Zn-dependent protease